MLDQLRHLFRPTALKREHAQSRQSARFGWRSHFSSVPEMAHAGEQHGHTQFVRGVYYFLVAHRSPRLNHRGGTSLPGFLNAIGKREKRVGCKYAVREGKSRTRRLDDRNFYRVHPAHLSGAHSQRATIAREYNGVRFHVLRDLPCEKECTT